MKNKVLDAIYEEFKDKNILYYVKQLEVDESTNKAKIGIQCKDIENLTKSEMLVLIEDVFNEVGFLEFKLDKATYTKGDIKDE